MRSHLKFLWNKQSAFGLPPNPMNSLTLQTILFFYHITQSPTSTTIARNKHLVDSPQTKNTIVKSKFRQTLLSDRKLLTKHQWRGSMRKASHFIFSKKWVEGSNKTQWQTNHSYKQHPSSYWRNKLVEQETPTCSGNEAGWRGADETRACSLHGIMSIQTRVVRLATAFPSRHLIHRD
jgi:hypothetical protein